MTYFKKKEIQFSASKDTKILLLLSKNIVDATYVTGLRPYVQINK